MRRTLGRGVLARARAARAQVFLSFAQGHDLPPQTGDRLGHFEHRLVLVHDVFLQPGHSFFQSL